MTPTKKGKKKAPKSNWALTPKQICKRIAEIIEAVDVRCMAADGPVPPTLQEMEQSEISEIYKLAVMGSCR